MPSSQDDNNNTSGFETSKRGSGKEVPYFVTIDAGFGFLPVSDQVIAYEEIRSTPGYWPSDTNRRITSALIGFPFCLCLFIRFKLDIENKRIVLTSDNISRLLTEVLREFRGIRNGDDLLSRVSAKKPRGKAN